MLTIRQSTEKDIESIKTVLRSSYNRSNEAGFFDAVRRTDTFIPELSMVAESDDKIAGYILLSRIGIRTANEILPTLIITPFCVHNDFRGRGIGGELLAKALRRAEESGFTSCITLECGDYFKKLNFLPARDEYGLELYFEVDDNNFCARELREDALYRRSGFLLFPSIFSLIDPAFTS